ncbi:MAG: hypothetical protein C4589_09605 [Peptococcaceae bacterium]|nr:MAG: hypothetical protein C4589_09605 [Peptococcaceae bacterium]
MRRLYVIIFIAVISISGCAKSGGNATIGEKAVISGQTGMAIEQAPVESGQSGTVSDNAAAISKNSNTDIDIPGIVSKQEAVMKEIKSFRADVGMEISVESGTSSNGNISVAADMKSDIDLDNRLLSSTISAGVSISGTRKEMEQRIIATNDKIYFKDAGESGTQSRWQVKTLDKASSESLWNEQDTRLTGLKYSGPAAPGSLVYAGKENSNGRTCLVLKQSLDWGSIMETSPELKEQLRSINGFMPEEFEKMIEKADVSYLVDEQTFHLREIRIEARINQPVQGRQYTGTIKQQYKFDAFNRPVSVKIPQM